MLRTLSVAVAIFLVSASSAAQAPTAIADSADGPIRIDGHADEAAWSGAEVLQDFTIYRPTSETEPLVDASARLLRDDEALYVFVEVDLDGAPIHAPIGRRDNGGGDSVEIQLDPWNRSVHGYAFSANAASVLNDARIRQGGGRDHAWDSLFDARSVETESGYAVEFRIPFQSLRFDPEQEEWGLHIYVHGHDAEQSVSWAPIDREDPDYFQQHGTVSGLGGGRPGRAVEVLPSITARVTQLGDSSEDDRPTCDFELDPINDHACRAELDYGVGFKWGISPSTTLDVVFNPDFSQIEADAGQLALNNRFALYLMERRPFFLEGRDIFNGPLGTVYTRSINRPLAATKVSSQLRSGRAGMMIAYDLTPPDSVLDDNIAPSDLDAETTALSTISRGVWDITNDNSIGLTLTSKQWFAEGQNSPYNLVLALNANTRIADRWWWWGALAGSTTVDFENNGIEGAAGVADLRYQTDKLRWFIHYRGYSNDYRSETGFVSRVDYNSIFTKLDGYYRSDNWWGRNISPGYWGEVVWDGNGEIEDTELGTNIYWRFAHRIWFFADYERYGERYRETVADEDLNTWFEGNSYWFSFGVNSLTWLNINPGISVRDSIIRDSDLRLPDEPAFMGAEVSPRLNVTIRPIDELVWNSSFTSRYLYREYGGDLLARQPLLYNALSYFPRREFELRAIVDWDIEGDALSSDFLFGWTPSPGNVLYVGFRQEDALNADTGSLVTRSAFLKFSRLFVR